MTIPLMDASIALALPDEGVDASHAVVFEEIARRQTRDQPWHSIAVGLTVIRLAEAWAHGERCDDWGIAQIERDVSELPETDAKRLPLLDIVRAMNQKPPRNLTQLVSRLSAYGRALEDEATWPVAVDVYQTVIRCLGVSSSAIVWRTFIRLGKCYQHLNCLPIATDMFEHGRVLAGRRGDVEGELLAELGKSRLVMLRGNIPVADAMIQRVLRRARENGLTGMQSRALHQAANVALYRKDAVTAARIGFEAFSLSEEESERYRILHDIGLALLLLRLYEPAREAHLAVASRAPEQVVRWASCLNLLEIESQVGDRTAFEGYVRVLAGSSLPPEQAAHFQLQIGEGLMRFGDDLVARDHLRRALAMAVEFGLSELVLIAEHQLAAAVRPDHSRVQEGVRDDLAEIVSAIRDLRPG